ncbi:hypothetical protein G6L61_23055, partial [Agrobacterium fabrum]|nr:hypothetical protein [Agrobacterium fabrum]
VGTLELPALLEKIGHDFDLHGKKFSYELYNIESLLFRGDQNKADPHC